MKRLLPLVLVLFFLSGTAPAITLDEIISNHLKAIGGKDSWKKIQSMKTSGKNLFGSFEFPFSQVVKRPGYSRLEVTIQGLTMVQAYDAKSQVGWMINPFQGSKEPRKMNEEQVKGFKDGLVIENELAVYKEKGWKAEYIGTDDLEGVEVYQIMIMKPDGDISYHFIDSETWLLLKTTSMVKFEDKEVESETQYSDFRTVNGIVMPFIIESMSGGKMVSQVKIDNVEFDIPLEEEKFVFPEKK
jgi:hypothetical protein